MDFLNMHTYSKMKINIVILFEKKKQWHKSIVELKIKCIVILKKKIHTHRVCAEKD